MISWLPRQRCGPIGVDIGSRSVKLLQFDAARTQVHESARWDLPPEPAATSDRHDARVVEALCHARDGRKFRGCNAVLCLGAGSLFVQNIRVAQATGQELTKIVHFEAAGRLPFASEEAEIRYFEAGDVKQGDTVRREVVLLACYRPALDRMLAVAEKAGLRAAAIDVEPAAMLRCYHHQFRRDDDQQRRMMFVNVGASTSVVVIAHGSDTMFIKYLDVGGQHFDEAVARHLKMAPADAVGLRRHHEDRRGSPRDPEVARGIDESIRPVLDRLSHELSLCLRYYCVTFRGQPLSQIVLSGGEATDALARWISAQLELPCAVGNPLRSFDTSDTADHLGQWDIAAGLALKPVN